MKPKLTATMLCGAMAATLIAGCGSSGSGSSGSGGGAVSGSLRVIGTADTQKAVSVIVNDFQKKHPGVKITTTFQPTTTYQTVTRTQLSGSQGADVLLAFPGGASAMSIKPLVKSNAILDLSGQPWSSKVKDAWKPLIAVNGKTYMYPLGGDTMGIVFSKKVFASAGVTPPTTLSGLISTCKTWTSKGVAPIAYGAKDTAFFMFNALVPSTVYRVDPTFDADHAAGKTSFASSPGWTDALNIVLKLKDAGCFNRGFEGTGYADMLKMLSSGKAAMAVTVPASLPTITAADPSGQYAVIPFPAYDKPADNWAAQALAVGFAVNSRTKNKEAALAFVDFANTTPEAEKFATALGDASLEPGAASPPALTAIVAKWKEGKFGPFPEQSYPNANVQSTEQAVVQEVLTGQASVKGALQQLDAAYSQK